METQTFVSLLNDTDNEPSKFETKKWYVINDQNNGEYGDGSENDSCIKFESLCDYSDAYVIVTENIKVANIDTNTNVAIKNCAPFTRCVTHIKIETKIETKGADKNLTRFYLDTSFQGVKRLFVHGSIYSWKW